MLQRAFSSFCVISSSFELGVFKGEFAIEILNRVQPKLLWLIDPWWLLGKHKDGEPLGRPTDWKNRGVLKWQ